MRDARRVLVERGARAIFRQGVVESNDLAAFVTKTCHSSARSATSPSNVADAHAPARRREILAEQLRRLSSPAVVDTNSWARRSRHRGTGSTRHCGPRVTPRGCDRAARDVCSRPPG